MEPYINPWFFYFMSVMDNLSAAIFFGIFITAAVLVFYVVCSIDDVTPDSKQRVKKCLVILLVLVVSAIIVPSQEVLMNMTIAKLVTPDNANSVLDAIKAASDYVFDGIRSLR